MSIYSVQLNEIQENLSAIQRQMFYGVKAQHGLISEVFDCSNESERALKDLAKEFGLVLSAIDDPSLNLTSVSNKSSIELDKVHAKIQSTKQIIEALESISNIHTLFTQVDAQLRNWEFESACTSILSVCDLLASIQGNDVLTSGDNEANLNSGGASEIVRLLKRQMRYRRTSLENQLRICLAQAVNISPGQLKVSSVLRGSQLSHLCSRKEFPVCELFATLERLDLLEDLAEDITERVWTNMLAPLLFCGKQTVPAPELTKSSDFATLSFRPKPSTGPMNSSASKLPNENSSNIIPDGCQVVSPDLCIDRSLVVLGFLAEELWGNDLSLVSRMARKLGGQNGKVITSCLKSLESYLPKEIDQLNQYQTFSGKCTQFEKRLEDWGYLTEQEMGSLCDWLAEGTKHFANKRRGQLLNQARALMLADYHNSVEVTDVTERGTLTAMAGVGKKGKGGDENDRVFFLPTCHVSLSTQELVEMTHQTLIQATRSPPELARTLYRTSRDMLDMFRSIVPLAHAEAISTVPRLAALFHNDCLYIAHHLLTMAYLYRPKLPVPLNRMANMVDMVPPFRELGERYLRSQVDRQCAEVLMFFDDVKLLGLVEDEEREKAEGAVRRVLYHFRQLAQAWQAVLPADVYGRVMGAVLEAVVSHLMAPTLAAREFSEEETNFLFQLFGTVLQAEDVFSSPSSVCVCCPSWAKFKVLTDLMEYSLDNISEMLPKGQFKDFSADELGFLIKAIFQESTRRAAVLTAIHKI